jgi:hypothetical protein
MDCHHVHCVSLGPDNCFFEKKKKNFEWPSKKVGIALTHAQSQFLTFVPKNFFFLKFLQNYLKIVFNLFSGQSDINIDNYQYKGHPLLAQKWTLDPKIFLFPNFSKIIYKMIKKYF